MANLRDVAREVEARGAKKLARGTVDMPLPLYGGKEYGARFGVLDSDRLDEMTKLAEGQTEISAQEALEANAQFVADACRVILKVDGKKREKLTHDDQRPVLFDEDFAEVLGLQLPHGRPIDSAMACVLAVFTVQDEDGQIELNAAGVTTLAINLLVWMQDTAKKVEGELLGESVAARP